jgi:hypothetical protein
VAAESSWDAPRHAKIAQSNLSLSSAWRLLPSARPRMDRRVQSIPAVLAAVGR